MHSNNNHQDIFCRIFGYLKEQRAVDFSGYKHGTIQRRLETRLLRTGMADYDAYFRYLLSHPAEKDLLMDAMTIKVSTFFRNPPVFKLLMKQILPKLSAAADRSRLRIWCAGCARGEEAYSIAILLKEIFDRQSISMPVFIIATDIDRNALAHAERACYLAEDLTGLEQDHLDRYFIRENCMFRLREEIRSMVTFAWHDLTTCRSPKEGIFSDYDLVLCRNTLIYFTRPLFEKVLECLAGVLANRGILVLGEAETITARLKTNFKEIACRSRMFIKEAS